MPKPSRAQRKRQAIQSAPQIIAPPPMVEICRSFSYTLQARQYEPRNFFCSFKTQCTPEDAVNAAESADEFCQSEVLKSVVDYKKKLAAQRGESAA